MKQIHVQFKDHGFFTEEPITVQRRQQEDGWIDILWCNHADVDYEEISEDYYNEYGPDISYTVKVYTCKKCGAHQFADDNIWHNAPSFGEH